MDRITLRGAEALPEVGPLELRAPGSGGLVFGQLLLGLPVVASLFTAPDRFRFLLAAIPCALVAVALPLLLVVQARQRALGVLVRLDSYGVGVGGGPAIPWGDLSEVRTVKGVVVLLPRPGVELPVVPSAAPFSRPGRRAAAYVRRYGSPLVLMPRALDATKPQILAAVRRLGRIPLGAD
ncbi:hypothetical protein [Streptomyces sp. WM6368]|uniref:hypothetical protein n=1 Tax=Streptomyces sp. WM6368 TaxID=1415554 RepID=UPI0006B0199A|nr:hypothetical protein [Streptomyces sp. WM6368]KOU20678.1 hypothetical protein ADK51_24095 [Streptomyces sp. WM6368]